MAKTAKAVIMQETSSRKRKDCVERNLKLTVSLHHKNDEILKRLGQNERTL